MVNSVSSRPTVSRQAEWPSETHGHRRACPQDVPALTSHLVTSMVDPEAYLNLEDHRECVVRWGQYGRTARLGCEQKFVDARGVNKPAVKRRDILAGAAGLWT